MCGICNKQVIGRPFFFFYCRLRSPQKFFMCMWTGLGKPYSLVLKIEGRLSSDLMWISVKSVTCEHTSKIPLLPSVALGLLIPCWHKLLQWPLKHIPTAYVSTMCQLRSSTFFLMTDLKWIIPFNTCFHVLDHLLSDIYITAQSTSLHRHCHDV